MGKTSRRTWQLCESRAAQLFGCRRAVNSGSAGRNDMTGSDSTHERLYLESKLRSHSAARALHDEAKSKATREGKVPVLALFDKNRPGFLLGIHSDDFPSVVAEFIVALDPEERARLDALLRQAHDRARPGAP
jgi:hypothetical protein